MEVSNINIYILLINITYIKNKIWSKDRGYNRQDREKLRHGRKLNLFLKKSQNNKNNAQEKEKIRSRQNEVVFEKKRRKRSGGKSLYKSPC